MDWDEFDDDPASIPLPRADRRHLIRAEDWRKAEGPCAGSLARAAQALGQLDGVMQMVGSRALAAAMHRRLALIEAGSMLWAQGCPISPDDLGRDQMSAGADIDLTGLQLGRWAVRRLEGQGEPDDLRGFLALHQVGRSGLAGLSGQRLTGEDFDAAAAEFQQQWSSLQEVHPITRAIYGRALWRLSDLSPETDLVESAVWAARRMALSSSALFFAPMGTSGRRCWLGGSDPVAQLRDWCDAVAEGATEARRLIIRLLDWRDRAGRTLARVKGDNAEKIIVALAAAPQALAADLALRAGCSRDTAERMLARLHEAGLVREITGAQRYRIWSAVA